MTIENTAICEKCGREIRLSEHPFCPHGFPAKHYPFKAYFDLGLGRQIDSQADRWRAQKELNVQPRDGMSKGDLSARQDRLEQQRRRA